MGIMIEYLLFWQFVKPGTRKRLKIYSIFIHLLVFLNGDANCHNLRGNCQLFFQFQIQILFFLYISAYWKDLAIIDFFFVMLLSNINFKISKTHSVLI